MTDRPKRRAALILLGTFVVLSGACVASRLVLPAPSLLCAGAPPGRYGSLEQCERAIAKYQSRNKGPRARLVQNNVGRCITKYESGKERSDCMRDASHESLWKALLRWP